MSQFEFNHILSYKVREGLKKKQKNENYPHIVDRGGGPGSQFVERAQIAEYVRRCGPWEVQ